MRFLLISNLITYFVTLMTVPLPIYGLTHDRNLGQFVVHLEPEAGFQFDEHSHLAGDYYRW